MVITLLKCAINSVCHRSWKKELTGGLDDMLTKVSVCMPIGVAPFFRWSLLTPIKVVHVTESQQPGP